MYNTQDRSLRSAALTLIVGSFLMTSNLHVFAQLGTIDPTFGTEGVVILQLPSVQTTIRSITEQSDGKIIGAGSMVITEDPFVRVGMLVRLLPDGQLDPDFGDEGHVTTEFIDAGSGTIMDMAVYQDGRIIICGENNNFGFVARFLADGSVDTDFGNGGFLNMDELLIPEIPMQLELTGDGSQIIVGFSGNPSEVIRLEAFDNEGMLDETFGVLGNTTWGFGGNLVLRAMCSDPTGDYFLAGDVTFDLTDPTYFPFVFRFLASGEPDLAYGESGVILLNPSPDQSDREAATALVPLADGSLVVGGLNNLLQATQNAFLFKLLPSSIPDPTFGEGGVVQTNFGAEGGLIGGPDGNLYLACSAVAGIGTAFAAQRFQADGTIDDTFGPDGVIQIDLEGAGGRVRCSSRQTNGRVLLAGNNSGDGLHFEAVVMRIRDDLNVGLLSNSTFASASLHPNPISDRAEFTFELKNEERLTAQILDTQGKLVSPLFTGRLCPPGHYRETIDFSGVAAGEYVLVLSNGSGTSSIKLTKSRARP